MQYLVCLHHHEDQSLQAVDDPSVDLLRGRICICVMESNRDVKSDASFTYSTVHLRYLSKQLNEFRSNGIATVLFASFFLHSYCNSSALGCQ